MKWTFDYLGKVDGKDYFCIISDDGTNRGQGLSVCYHYYVRNEDKCMKSLNYMSIPNFKERPSTFDSSMLMNEVTRFFHGWIPFTMNIAN